MRILCAADAAFAGPLCAMLVSLLAHHPKNRQIIIYVLGTEIPEQERQRIAAALCENSPGFTESSLHWLSPDKEIFRDLPMSEHINLETYSRLLAPFVLPEDCDRVLYLDSDMIILSDISEIYDSESNGGAVHAARDLTVGTVSSPMGVFNFSDLGIPPETPYFNGGVMLMHLPCWRKKKIADQILQYLKLYKSSVHFWDQGGLNAILYDSWTEIDPAWNQTRAVVYPELWTEQGFSIAEWRRVSNHPKIIHYTGGFKPWLPTTELLHRPGYSYFFKYLHRTPYRNAFTGPYLERIIGYRAYNFLWHTMRNVYHLFKSVAVKRS